jgi:ATPase family AAA domain-containing protein 3A/B
VKARLEAKEYRETVLEGIKLAAGEVGQGLQAFLGDRERLTSAAITLSAVALGVYTAKVGGLGVRELASYLLIDCTAVKVG